MRVGLGVQVNVLEGPGVGLLVIVGVGVKVLVIQPPVMLKATALEVTPEIEEVPIENVFVIGTDPGGQPTVPHQLMGVSKENMVAAKAAGEDQTKVCGLEPETVSVKFEPT